MGYDGTLKFDTSIDSSGFQAGLSKLSGLASSAIKATTAVIGGAASAVAVLVRLQSRSVLTLKPE